MTIINPVSWIDLLLLNNVKLHVHPTPRRPFAFSSGRCYLWLDHMVLQDAVVCLHGHGLPAAAGGFHAAVLALGLLHGTLRHSHPARHCAVHQPGVGQGSSQFADLTGSNCVLNLHTPFVKNSAGIINVSCWLHLCTLHPQSVYPRGLICLSCILNFSSLQAQHKLKMCRETAFGSDSKLRVKSIPELDLARAELLKQKQEEAGRAAVVAAAKKED